LDLLKTNNGIIMINFYNTFVSEKERLLYDKFLKQTNSSSQAKILLKNWHKENPFEVINIFYY
jgi:hypothetical protein